MQQRRNWVAGERSEALGSACFDIVLNSIKVKFIRATVQKQWTVDSVAFKTAQYFNKQYCLHKHNYGRTKFF